MKKKSTSNHEMVMSSVSSNGNLKTSVELKDLHVSKHCQRYSCTSLPL